MKRQLTTALVAISVIAASGALAQPVFIRTADPIVTAAYKAKQAGMAYANAGLEQLIRQGALRRVSKNDINGWTANGARLAMVAGPYVTMRERIDPLQGIGGTTSAYLVLKPLEAVPDGLAGADAVIFIVPEGVPTPGLSQVEHNTFYKLQNYRGIPPAGPPVPLDMRARMIEAREGPKRPPVDEASQGSFSEGYGTAPSPKETATSTSLLWPLALFMVLGLAGATTLLLRRRARLAAAFEGRHEVPSPPMNAIAPVPAAMPKDDVQEEHVIATLREIGDASSDERLQLEVVKMERTIRSALKQEEYDPDLAAELDDLVERKLMQAMRIYVRAIRIADALIASLDAELLTRMREIRERVEQIVNEQGSRDAESIATTG